MMLDKRKIYLIGALLVVVIIVIVCLNFAYYKEPINQPAAESNANNTASVNEIGISEGGINNADIVASAKLVGAAKDFKGALSSRGMHINIVDSSSSEYTGASLVFLIGEISSDFIPVTEYQKADIAKRGVSKVFMLRNLWKSPQTVIVFTGVNQKDIEKLLYDCLFEPRLPAPSLSAVPIMSISTRNPVLSNIITGFVTASNTEQSQQLTIGKNYFYDASEVSGGDSRLVSTDQIISMVGNVMQNIAQESIEEVYRTEYEWYIPAEPVSLYIEEDWYVDPIDFVSSLGDVFSTSLQNMYESSSFSVNYNISGAGLHRLAGTIKVPELRMGDYVDYSGYYFIPGTFILQAQKQVFDVEKMARHNDVVMYRVGDVRVNSTVNIYQVLLLRLTVNEYYNNMIRSEPSHALVPYGTFKSIAYPLEKRFPAAGGKTDVYKLEKIEAAHVDIPGAQQPYVDAANGIVSWNIYVPTSINVYYRYNRTELPRADKVQIDVSTLPGGFPVRIEPPGVPIAGADSSYYVARDSAITVTAVNDTIHAFGKEYMFECWKNLSDNAVCFAYTPSLSLKLDGYSAIQAQYSQILPPQLIIDPSDVNVNSGEYISMLGTAVQGTAVSPDFGIDWYAEDDKGVMRYVKSGKGYDVLEYSIPNISYATTRRIDLRPSDEPYKSEDSVYHDITKSAIVRIHPNLMKPRSGLEMHFIPENAEIEAGKTEIIEVLLRATGHVNPDIHLYFTGNSEMPLGTTATLNSYNIALHQGDSYTLRMTVRTSKTTKIGTYNIQIAADDGGNSQVSASAYVTIKSAGFDIESEPASIVIKPPTLSTIAKISVISYESSPKEIELSVMPNDLDKVNLIASFSRIAEKVQPPATKNLMISASMTTPPGDYTVTVEASDGSFAKELEIPVTIEGPPPKVYTCTDSDNGADDYIVGTCVQHDSRTNEDTTFADVCDNDKQLKEYYCSMQDEGDICEEKIMSCTTGSVCIGGSCKVMG